MTVSASNEVSYVGQSDKFSCWAAAATMMLGWRDQVCYASDQDIRDKYGDMGGDTADVEECLQLALGQGMRVLPEMCRTPEGWEQLLKPGHFIVVSAIEGDGTPEGTDLYVLDPWDTESWQPYATIEEQYELDSDYGNDLLQY
jgi:Papain-like cysteine protease AvrRpt2